MVRSSILAVLALATLAPLTPCQEHCPMDASCVQSITRLTYDAGAAMMDAFNFTTSDYTTAYWYELCANLAILKMDGTEPYGHSVLWPSRVPVCSGDAISITLTGEAAATPGLDYVAMGSATTGAVFQYGETLPGCYVYCTGYLDDELAYSWLLVTQPPVDGPSSPFSATEAPTPSQTNGGSARSPRRFR